MHFKKNRDENISDMFLIRASDRIGKMNVCKYLEVKIYVNSK
jgi:hypothetical protein